jgi:SAM-dependent methyltransferase
MASMVTGQRSSDRDHSEDPSKPASKTATFERPEDRYYDGERGDLLSWVGGWYRNVLEIGCGRGGNARWLRDHGAQHIVGIELDAASAAAASIVLDRVLAQPAEEALAVVEEQFDLIICADVLEHLLDPWTFVAALGRNAAPDATLVVSIPNIRFIRALWQIAAGDGFRYERSGIFDRTHLRFFTRGNVEDMLVAAGWIPDRWGHSTSLRQQRLREWLFRATRGRSGEYLAYQWFVAAHRRGAPTDRSPQP